MKDGFKADIHVHSKYSNKPSIWALRKLNCPESFTEPKFIYETALKKGMDLVTITDHNTIEGALEIAHLPNTFLSSEITSYFPENRCKVHIVVLNINENHFLEILRLRQNIYELIGYLRENEIAHFIAHPLYELNGKLTVEIVEKMMLLFNIIETKSGARGKTASVLIEKIIGSLTREKIEILANRHNIEPYGTTPWKKSTVGGSDDHSGVFIARAYTASTKAYGVQSFIKSIKDGDAFPEGCHGDPLTLAHSLYGIGYRFFKERMEQKKSGRQSFIRIVAEKMFNVEKGKVAWRDKIRFLLRRNFRNGTNVNGTFEEMLENEAMNLLSDKKLLNSLDSEGKNRKIFIVTSKLANRMFYLYIECLTRMYSNLGLLDLVNSITSILFAHVLVAPYYVAYHSQHRNKRLMVDISRKMLGEDSDSEPKKIALFTDTLNEINGVAITIKRTLETAKKRGIEFVVITSTKEETGIKNGVMNFKAIGEFSLPEYPEMKMSFPPILDLIDYIEKEGFNKIHISTPGSLGIVGLLVAKLLSIPTAGTYHTDIPRYVRDLTNDYFLENAAWNYMIWFYNLLDEVLVPSSSTGRQLVSKGLDKSKIKPLPRWVDTTIFNPAKKDPDIWQKYSFEKRIKLLYVGRVSKEKNLELLCRAFQKIHNLGYNTGLVIVGDGPYREEMQKMLEGYPVLFTGYKTGDELHCLYASSDLFVFPSTTDTFGNVVLEAQASGLPVIVSDEGGPAELVIKNKTGIVISAGNINELVSAIISLLDNEEKMRIMGKNARWHTEKNALDAEDEYKTILYDDINIFASTF